MSQYHNREQDKIIKLKRFLKKIKMPSAEIFRKLINGGDGGGCLDLKALRSYQYWLPSNLVQKRFVIGPGAL